MNRGANIPEFGEVPNARCRETTGELLGLRLGAPGVERSQVVRRRRAGVGFTRRCSRRWSSLSVSASHLRAGLVVACLILAKYEVFVFAGIQPTSPCSGFLGAFEIIALGLPGRCHITA